MVLGEQIYEARGKMIGQRVLPPHAKIPKAEGSWQGNVKILETDANEIGTWTYVIRPTGVMFGEGQGIITTKDGEIITYSGQGIGIPKAGGAANWRGAAYFKTSAERLGRLNSVVAVFEWDSDAEGNYQAKSWEWK